MRLDTTRPLDGHVVDTVTGCWPWAESLNGKGYGRWWDGKRPVLAHRFYYERLVGPIPPDRPQLDHLCRNRTCVNPEHIEPVTSADNTRRGDKTKLTVADVQAIRAAVDTMQKDLAVMYGISACNVSHIISRRSWKDV